WQHDVSAQDVAVGAGDLELERRPLDRGAAPAAQGRRRFDSRTWRSRFHCLRPLGRRCSRPQWTETGFNLARLESRPMSRLAVSLCERWLAAKRDVNAEFSIMNRRDFLRTGLAAGGAQLFASQLWGFEPVSVANPLGVYPSRDWEEVYRDQYRYDR